MADLPEPKAIENDPKPEAHSPKLPDPMHELNPDAYQAPKAEIPARPDPEADQPIAQPNVK